MQSVGNINKNKRLYVYVCRKCLLQNKECVVVLAMGEEQHVIFMRLNTVILKITFKDTVRGVLFTLHFSSACTLKILALCKTELKTIGVSLSQICFWTGGVCSLTCLHYGPLFRLCD